MFSVAAHESRRSFIGWSVNAWDIEMGLGAGTRGCPACAVDHQIDAEGLPVRKCLRRVEVRNLATADAKQLSFDVTSSGQRP
jgi:hypothetical protein